MKKSQDISSHRKSEPEESVLYIVATPIGNLNDISKRAIHILQNVSYIFCEDTRNTSKLINYLNISNKLNSFHEHNAQKKIPHVISKLKNGDSVALVSDAGMPLISDPGETLVNEVKNNNLEVICISGPCAALNALISSGLSTKQFTFFGFIPKKSKERYTLLKLINNNQYSSIIFESPKRIKRLLLDLKNFCGGQRGISVSKEMTKKYEKHYGKNIDEVIDIFKNIEPKGEYTIVLSGTEIINQEIPLNFSLIKKELVGLIEAGLSHSSASAYLSNKHGLPKKKIYNLIIN